MQFIRKAALGLIVALAILVSPFGAGVASADPASAEADFMGRLNALRVSRGLPALGVDPRLVDLARDWSNQMAAAGRISHRPDLGSHAPAGWTRISENVGVGPSVESLHNALVNSAGHFANMVDPKVSHVGIGVVEANGLVWVTQNFAGYRSGFEPVAAPAGSTVFSSSSDGGAPSQGYWLLGRDGGVFSFGSAGFFGSTGDIRLNRPVVSMAPTPSGNGYWFVASDGGIFAFGDAGFFGSTGDMALNSPIIGMAPTSTGRGYWLVAADGGVFAFGDAGFVGSLGGSGVTSIVGMSPMRGGNGYWLVDRSGTVYSFGDAGFFGSGSSSPASAIVSSPSGNGYWVLGSAGDVSGFGDAQYLGSPVGRTGSRAVGMSVSASGAGYRVTTADGVVFAYGDARHYGDLAGTALSAPIVGSAA